MSQNDPKNDPQYQEYLRQQAQGGQQQAPPPQVIIVKQQRSRGCMYIVIAIVVLAIVGGAIYSQQKSSGQLAFTVTYKVTGTASKPTISYNNGTGGTEQNTAVILPWQQSYSFNSGSFFGTLVVTTAYQDTGSVTCQILVNDKVVKQATSSGSLAITTCSGSFSVSDGK
jgi:Mycobacterium membrane protein